MTCRDVSLRDVSGRFTGGGTRGALSGGVGVGVADVGGSCQPATGCAIRLRFSATKASVPNPRGVLSRADLGSDFDEAPQKRMPCNDGGLGLPAETLTSTGWAS